MKSHEGSKSILLTLNLVRPVCHTYYSRGTVDLQGKYPIKCEVICFHVELFMDHGIRAEVPPSPSLLTCVPIGSQVAICAAQICISGTHL